MGEFLQANEAAVLSPCKERKIHNGKIHVRNFYYSAVYLQPFNVNFPCENLKILINLALVHTDYAYMFFFRSC